MLGLLKTIDYLYSVDGGVNTAIVSTDAKRITITPGHISLIYVHKLLIHTKV